MGMCPRATVTADWPCDVPNGSGETNVHGHPADPATFETFQISFERMSRKTTDLERRFEWAWWFVGGLKGFLPKPEVAQAAKVNAGMTFISSLCFSYDAHLLDWLPTHVSAGVNFHPDFAAPTCDASAVEASPFYHMHTALATGGSPVEALNRIHDFMGKYVGHFHQNDPNTPDGPHPWLDVACGCRHRVCGLRNTTGLPAGVVAYAQEVCGRTFTVPITDRRYSYHAPALHPQFKEEDFTAFVQLPALAAPQRALEVTAGPVALAAAGQGLKVALLLVGQPKTQSPVILESYRARLLDPYRAAGHTVDVYLCETLQLSDKGTRLVLDRLAPYTVYDIQAVGQEYRQDACYEKLMETHKANSYDWYVRSRPDLVLWDTAPELATLDATAIHARLLGASGISGVFQGTFSWAWEDPTCWAIVCMPGSCATNCTVHDDQLAFVPAAMAEAYFLTDKDDANAPGSGQRRVAAYFAREGKPVPQPVVPECQWTRNGFQEGFTDRKTLRLGGRFVPLTLESRLFLYKGGKEVPDRNQTHVPKTCPPNMKN